MFWEEELVFLEDLLSARNFTVLSHFVSAQDMIQPAFKRGI